MADTITNYEWFALNNLSNKCMKNFVSAILLSAIEDADIEFFEDDYDSWKELYKKREKINEEKHESYYIKEFEYKQYCKELIFQILQTRLKISDIPQNIINERKMFENNSLENLVKLTNIKKQQLLSIAKMHDWKIGIDYEEPTLFDDDF